MMLILFSLAVILFFLPAQVSAQTLDFADNNLKPGVDNNTSVSVNLDPQGSDVLGVDLILKYDPQYIEVIDITSTGAFSQSAGKTIDNTSGTVKFAVFESRGSSLNSKQDIANLTLRAKRTGSTFVDFDYTTGNSRDTNITSVDGEDITKRVGSMKVTINSYNSSNSQSDNNTNDTSSSDETEQTGEVLAAEDDNIVSKVKEFIFGDKEEEATPSAETVVSDEPTKHPTEINYPAEGNIQQEKVEKTSIWNYTLYLVLGLILGVTATVVVDKIRKK